MTNENEKSKALNVYTAETVQDDEELRKTVRNRSEEVIYILLVISFNISILYKRKGFEDEESLPLVQPLGVKKTTVCPEISCMWCRRYSTSNLQHLHRLPVKY